MSETQKAKMATVEQISAGGVVFRTNGSEIEIAIVAPFPKRRWQLPKGLIDEGETPEIAALRETREEAGIEAEIVEKIETVEYWYVGEERRGAGKVRFHKFVHFYLMKYAAGDVSDHDHEIAEARWARIDEAIEMLAFKGEKDAAAKAKNLIEKL